MSQESGLRIFFIISVILGFIHLAALRYLLLREVIMLRWLLGILPLGIISLHLIGARFPNTIFPWLFHLRFEHNFSSTLSSILLLSASMLAFGVSAVLKQANGRLSMIWFFWAGVYFFLSYDEVYMFHESIPNWRGYFALLGVLLVTAAVYAGVAVDRGHWRIYLLLLTGLGITAGGGLILDDAIASSYLLEEFMEVTGTIYVLSAAYTYLRQQAEVPQRIIYRVLTLGSTIWIATLLAFTLWPLPALEARSAADSVSAEYLDSALSLLGYKVDARAYSPGEWIPVRLYWQANQRLSANYSYSVQLLESDSGAIVQEAHSALGPPTKPGTMLWPEHLTFRTTVYLKTRTELAAPADYQLTVIVWEVSIESDWLLVSQTSGTLLRPGTLLLIPITFIP